MLSPAAPSSIEIVGTTLFAVALVHTFSTGFFQHLSRSRRAHAGLLHLLGEVEVVFGFWAMILVIAMMVIEGSASAERYLDGLSYVEPLFVFAIMTVAGSRPIQQLAGVLVSRIALALPLPAGAAYYLVTLSAVPLLGSLITEPAAMTLAALILRDRYLSRAAGSASGGRSPASVEHAIDSPAVSTRFKYATLGVLFVNVSIGGTLTPFAAPPVLMVAAKWQWDALQMLSLFGWKAAAAVLVNALAVTWLLRRELQWSRDVTVSGREAAPASLMTAHLVFLVFIIFFAHHAPLFIAALLLFIGFTQAYPRHQDPLILREALLVAFFLGGLVVLGTMQRWWLQPLLAGLGDLPLFFGATALTAVTDNAALTYLGSLADITSEGSRYALVAGAVTGGGLTVIANAPNPVGLSILKSSFDDQMVRPLPLLLAALPPTLIAMLAFLLFR